MHDVWAELRVDGDAPECSRGVAEDGGLMPCKEAELPTPLLLLLLLLLLASPLVPRVMRVSSHRYVHR